MDHLSDEYIESVDLQSLTAFTGQSRAFCDPHTTFSTFGFASFMMITVQLVMNIITVNNNNNNNNNNQDNDVSKTYTYIFHYLLVFTLSTYLLPTISE